MSLLSGVDLVSASQAQHLGSVGERPSSESECYKLEDIGGVDRTVCCQGGGLKNPIFRVEEVASNGTSGYHPDDLPSQADRDGTRKGAKEVVR